MIAQLTKGCAVPIGNGGGEMPGMSPDLNTALREEESIWQIVYSHQALSTPGWQAYWYPPFPGNPHWNVAYPRPPIAAPLTPENLALIDAFYRDKGIPGHVMVLDDQFAGRAISNDEYFFLEPSMAAGNVLSTDIQIKLTHDIRRFCEIVREGFGFPESLLEEFQKQLTAISQRTASRFYLAYCGESPCRAVSTFRTAGNFDFVMNLTTLTPFRQRGVARQLVAKVLEDSEQGVLVHTNSKELRERLFPRLGFGSLGTVQIVPLAEVVLRR